MSDLEERLRRAYDPVPPVTVPEIRDRARRRSRNRRAAIGGSLVIVVGLAVGVGVLARHTPNRTTTSAGGPGSTVATGPSGSAKPTGASGAKAKSHTVSVTKNGITVRFTLDTPTVVQGGDVKGVLTVKTPTAVRGCPGTFYALIFSNSETGSQGGAFSSPACVKVVIGPGTHTYRVSSPARYGACTQSGKGTLKLPRCRGRSTMPALPVGAYTLKLAYNVNLPVPPGLSVRIDKA
jgi:hypothetical protein